MTNYADRPLADLMTGRQRAEAAGDQKAVQEFDGVIQYHPERLAAGYAKAATAGDIDAQEEFRRRYYGQRKPSNDTLPGDPLFLQDAAQYYQADQGKPFEGSPEDLGKWALSRIGQFNYNTVTMGKEAFDAATKYDRPGSQALLGLLDAYDKLPVSLEGTGRLLKGIVTDPTTYVTGGVGAAVKLVGRGAAKKGAVEAMKLALRKKLKDEVSDTLVEAGAKDLVESGITRTGGRTLARSAGAGAAAGAGYGAAADLSRQSVEVGAGAREDLSGGQALGAAAVGGALGGGLGAALGSGAGRRARKSIQGTADAVRVGADVDGTAATVAIQKAAIDQAGDEAARRQSSEIVQRLQSGSSPNPSEDLRALSQLTIDTTKKAGVDSNARFNADAANTAFVGSAVRAGDMFQRLRRLHDLGVVNTRTMNDIDHALRAGKSPKGFGRLETFERAIGQPGVSAEAKDILRGLKGEVDIMDRLVRVRNLKDQKSLPLQVLDDPRARALFDVYNPFGGSTGARVGLRFAEPLLAKLGIAPTPVSRSAAARARMSKTGPHLQAVMSQLDAGAMADMAGTNRAYGRFARLQDARNFERQLKLRRDAEAKRAAEAQARMAAARAESQAAAAAEEKAAKEAQREQLRALREQTARLKVQRAQERLAAQRDSDLKRQVAEEAKRAQEQQAAALQAGRVSHVTAGPPSMPIWNMQMQEGQLKEAQRLANRAMLEQRAVARKSAQASTQRDVDNTLLGALDESMGAVDARGGLQQQWRDATGLTNAEVLKGLRLMVKGLESTGQDTKQLAKVIKDFEANRPISKGLFYRLQDRLNAMADSEVLKREREAIRPATPTTGSAAPSQGSDYIASPASYEAAVLRAEEAATRVTDTIMQMPLPQLQKAQILLKIQSIRELRAVADKEEVFRELLSAWEGSPEVHAVLMSLEPAIATGVK